METYRKVFIGQTAAHMAHVPCARGIAGPLTDLQLAATHVIPADLGFGVALSLELQQSPRCFPTRSVRMVRSVC